MVSPLSRDTGTLFATPWQRRIDGGLYVGRNRQVWLYRELPLAPLQWEDPHRRLEVLTIIKRKDALGMLAHGDAEDVFTRSREEMTALIRIAMGGQAAEELFFGDVSTGPAGDLLYATNVAAQMVGSAGMKIGRAHV